MGLRLRYLLLSTLLLLFLSSVTCTEIKFTPGAPPRSRADSAPRSQRYWDENKIERPDYAKTDAEVWQEKWGPVVDRFKVKAGRAWRLAKLYKYYVLLVAVFAAAAVGGREALRKKPRDGREAREARLKR